MFERPHHRAIARVLAALDADLLRQSGAFFGGGTAIVLQLGEYRESQDIDFLCSSTDGYRLLREATFGGRLDRLMVPNGDVRVLRDVRADQYGIRTQLGIDDITIRFEIVREGRVALGGSFDAGLGVPVLSRDDMYCEKLLANADRHADRAVLSRDIVDLSMMILRWGPIPEASWQKATAAYGHTARLAFDRAVGMIRDPEWLDRCLAGMAMSQTDGAEILALHGGPVASD
jgi:hypothetical protein